MDEHNEVRGLPNQIPSLLARMATLKGKGCVRLQERQWPKTTQKMESVDFEVTHARHKDKDYDRMSERCVLYDSEQTD